MGLTDVRDGLLADRSLRGADFTRAYSAAADAWLTGILEEAADDLDGLALVATGGYGRGELFPGSDLDLLLLHAPERELDGLPDRLWYPVWDEGLKLGHSVATVEEALTLAVAHLDVATALLSARRVTGDAALVEALRVAVDGWWRGDAERQLLRLADAVERRHDAAGEVAYLLEPDLKSGRGGLRDVQALRWADAARPVLDAEDRLVLDAAALVLTGVRVELHRSSGRADDRLLLEEQDAVAAALDHPDADALVAELAATARSVAWISDETWRRARHHATAPPARRDRPVAPGVLLRDGRVHIVADPADDPAVALRAAASAARAGTDIDRRSLARLAEELPDYPTPWPGDARERLVELLAAGRRAVPVLEALDHVGVLTRILPEWEPVRSRPQRNAYHRYTVDRHLHEAAVEASRLVARVDRPDLLLVGTWLHDLGKGYPGDHTETGVELMRAVAPRMGFPPADVAVLADMVRHHLLLPDVATRRDLGDDTTLRQVAAAVGDRRRLQLLAALTEADSKATGPSAWGSWKASLVELLVDRVEHLMSGQALELDDHLTDAQRALLELGPTRVAVDDDQIAVVADDRPGTFSRVAGALALAGLDVLEATARSADGNALAVFRVTPAVPGSRPDGEAVSGAVLAALGGRLALDARVADRERLYRTRIPSAAVPARTAIEVTNDHSDGESIVEVRTADRTGVLYRLTKALSELDLDIRHAKVQTLGHEVVDSFYVTPSGGGGRLDDEHVAEVIRAVRHAIGEGGAGG